MNLFRQDLLRLCGGLGIAFSVSALGAEFRAARSVHLGFPAPDGELFYQEMVIEKSINGSYFMTARRNTGYFGLQQLDSATHIIVPEFPRTGPKIGPTASTRPSAWDGQ